MYVGGEEEGGEKGEGSGEGSCLLLFFYFFLLSSRLEQCGKQKEVLREIRQSQWVRSARG